MDGPQGEAARASHLRHCTNSDLHKAHRAKVAKRDAAIARRSRNEMKQEDVERLAAHRFLGGGAGTAWMLTDTQLKQVRNPNQQQ